LSGVFITGSGTGVGKTFVTLGLIHCLKRQGQKVQALKPVVSGFDPLAMEGSDPALILNALGRALDPEELDRIAPWRFQAPLSPDMAASAERRTIDFSALVTFCRTALAEASGALLIEGIGGVMVPLDERHTVLDLMASLKQAVVLVTGSYLGALSHTLCAAEAILHRSLDLRAILVSESEGATVPLDATLSTLARFTSSPLLALSRSGFSPQNEKIFQNLAGLLSCRPLRHRPSCPPHP